MCRFGSNVLLPVIEDEIVQCGRKVNEARFRSTMLTYLSRNLAQLQINLLGSDCLAIACLFHGLAFLGWRLLRAFCRYARVILARE